MEKWLIPCNLKYYNIQDAFLNLKCLDWKQSNKSILPGDEVFIYVGLPIKAIKYKCKVNKVNLPICEIDDSKFVLNGEPYKQYGNYMELEIVEEYDEYKYSLNYLHEIGIKGNIQGPRCISGYELIY